MIQNKQIQTIRKLEPYVRNTILPKYVKATWQPNQLLPNVYDEIKPIVVQEMAKNVPDEVFISLVGNAITEECLPSYVGLINRMISYEDHKDAWANWIRIWSSEENKHGDVLNRYLYLSGRVNMNAFEKHTQELILKGFGSKLDEEPYLFFLYTSFQELATKVAHMNVGKYAKTYGDTYLSNICTIIACDESRHAFVYRSIVKQLLLLDPDGMMIAFAKIMRNGIEMPAGEMQLFSEYVNITSVLEIYTVDDYIKICEYLCNFWNIEYINVSTREAQEAKNFICAKHIRILKRLKKSQNSKKTSIPSIDSFDWLQKI